MNSLDTYITDANFSIITKDVSMVGIKRSDYETLYRYETSEDFNLFCLNRTKPISNFDDFKNRFEKFYSKQRKFQFIIKDNKENNLGIVFCSREGIVNGNSNICLYLDKKARGNPIIWRAMSVLFIYMFKEMKLIKIYTKIMEDNKISLKVTKHFGFVQEAFFPKHYIRADGNHIGIYVFALYPDTINKWYINSEIEEFYTILK